MKHVELNAGHLYQPFWTIKIQPGWPKLGIFEGTKYSDFWLFLTSPADPVEFLGFKMAGTGVPHIVLHVSCWTRTSRGYFRPQKSVLSKIAIFCCFWAKIGGSLTRERLVKMIFFIK